MKTRIARTLPLFGLTALISSSGVNAQDADGDFLTNGEELQLGTNPADSDTDGDGISDRNEVFPFSVVAGAFTYDAALADAKSKGGRLAVIDSPQKLLAIKRGLLTAALPNPLPNNFDPTVTLANQLWIGANDKLIDGKFQWADLGGIPTNGLDGNEILTVAFGDMTPGSNLVTDVVNINALKVGRPFITSGVPSGTTITAIDVATRTVTLSNPVEGILSKRIASVVVTNGGAGYTTDPVITFVGGSPGISSISVADPGSGYTSPPTVTFTGGGGTGANAVAQIDGTGKVSGITLTSRGNGYTSEPTVTLNGGFGVSGVNVTNSGTGYTSAPTVTFSGGLGIRSMNVTASGAGYTSTPTVTVAGGVGLTSINVAPGDGGLGYSGAPTVTLTGGIGLSSLAITAGGTGYTEAPSVALTGGIGLEAINVTAGGSGYTAVPAVVFTGGGGAGALATALVSGGRVVGIALTNPGTGYTSAPTISFTGGGGGTGAAATATIGTAATAEAVVSNGALVGLSIVNPGRGYSTAPTVVLGGGVGLRTATITAVGSGYATAPTVSFTGGGGTGATATATVNAAGAVNGITITNPGTGYTSAPTVVFTGSGTGATATVTIGTTATATATIGAQGTATAILSGGVVTGINLSGLGNGYTAAPTVNLSGGTPLIPAVATSSIGTPATAEAVITNGQLTGINMTSSGAGYNSAPTLNLVGGTPSAPGAATAVLGTGATATATVAGGLVTRITLTSAGSNYTSAPLVTLSGGAGTGATAVAVFGAGTQATAIASLGGEPTAKVVRTADGKIKSITVTADGSRFYNTAPIVAINGDVPGGVDNATAVATLTPDASASISSITLSSGGSGYTAPPAVTISGGGGTGATGLSSVTNGAVTGVSVVNPGSGFITAPTVALGGGAVTGVTVTSGGVNYATAPTVVFVNGGGSGATGTAVLTGGQVSGVTITNGGTGYTSEPTVVFTGGNPFQPATGTSTINAPATAVATIKRISGQFQSPNSGAQNDADAYSNWAAALPGNRQNSAEGVFLNTGTGFTWGTAQTSLTRGYLLELLPTDPTRSDADTDGDGLTNAEEEDFGSDPLLVDTDADGLTDLEEFTLGTNPVVADTDGDGVRDGPEVKRYGTNPLEADTDGDGLTDFFEIFRSKTNPLLADTDGDGLTDSQEINGSGGFTSDPLVVDTDGDLVSDFVEVNANPPTNPRDGTSVPSGVVPTLSDLHTIPVKSLTDRTVSVDQTFAPFGHRPDTDKSGEDGSVAIRDRNGAIIWVDNLGNASVIPNSSLARTLYVTNTECVMYNNRYDGTYNARGSVSNIVMYRRQQDGTLVASPTININQTVIETAPITPVTFGFTIIAGATTEDGAESRERFQSGTTNAGPVYDIRNVDVWDLRAYSMYQITWDGRLQSRGGTFMSVPNNSPNTGEFIVGGGSDGSFIFTMAVARNFYADRPEGGTFDFEFVDFWATWNLNAENIRRLQPSGFPASTNVAYISNSKLIIEYDEVLPGPPDNNLLPTYIPTGNFELYDFRQRPNGVTNLVNVFPLDPGYSILPASSYTRSGTPAYIYGISDARTNVQLYLADAALDKIGASVDLPGVVLSDTSIVRNPIDASLLMKSEGDTGMIWLPTSVNQTSGLVSGFETPRSLQGTTLGLPMFVNYKEAVVWVNKDAPVDLANGGVVPEAVINHFQINSTGVPVATTLAPPIEGRYVALPFALSPDADTEGWYVTTFEKSDARSAIVRTYRLQLSSNADRDSDGLSDYLEIQLGTDPGNPDTDNDGISDGDEVRPYSIVTGSFTWEEARRDARAKGGRLMVPSTEARQSALRAKIGSAVRLGGRPLWIGGHDQITETFYQWVNGLGDLKGPRVTYTNWSTFQPDNINDADGMEIRANVNLTWSMARTNKRQGYVIEFGRTNPLSRDTDGDGLSDGEERIFRSDPTKKDTDGDGLTDRQERNFGTDPRAVDTDKDGLSDFAEVRTHNTDPLLADTDLDTLIDGDEVTLGTNPLVADTDGDGLADGAEVTRGSDPLNPDTDGDGLTDGREVTAGTNLLVKDTDKDGISDFDEVRLGSDPLDSASPKRTDTDRDGLTDYEELFIYNTNPKNRDTDGDGLTDKFEVNRGTNPNKADTDGDGVNDYDEIYVLNTDPNSPSFGSPGQGVNVPFQSPAVKGDYEGIVYGAKEGLSFRQKLRIAADGSFTTSLSGLRKDGSFRGKFSAKGLYSAPVGVIPGVTEVEMSVVKRSATLYVVQGSYKTRSGGTLYFELRPEGYKGPRAYKRTSALTFDAARTGNARGPLGSSVATGEVRSDGRVSFRIYMPDGSRGSFSGPILAGNTVAFYTRTAHSAPSVMLGSVSFKPIKGVSDFNGSVRLFSAAGSVGGLFPTGFDQRRTMTGSRYYRPAAGTLPAANFKVTNNNVVFRWKSGNFSGVSKVGTWTTDGRMVVPATQNDRFASTFDPRSGLLSVNYTRTDAARGLSDSLSKGHAVILQKRNTFKGYYSSDRSAGEFLVLPNSKGLVPDVTSVSPLSKFVPAAAITYTVAVNTKGTWSVAIPADLTWVTATVSSASGTTGPSTTTQGDGNGTVTITVAQNATNTRREGLITIAGLTHKLTQEFR